MSEEEAKPRRRRSRKPQLGDELTPRERRCLALMALGYNDAKIGKNLGAPFGKLDEKYVKEEIRDACTKLGMGPRRAMLWLLDNLGDEARQMQVEAAERRRAQLRASGMLTPQRVQVAMLYANPDNCDMSHREIGELVTPEQVSSTLVGRYVTDMSVNIGPNGSLNKLIAVLHLAPLSARTTTDEDVPPPETL